MQVWFIKKSCEIHCREVSVKRKDFGYTEMNVFGEKIELWCCVGLKAKERKEKQLVVISFACMPCEPTFIRHDDIRTTIDYKPIYSGIMALGRSNRSRRLIETLAHEVALICFKNKKVEQVAVSVQKPNKLPGCKSVGVEILFKRKGV